MSTLLRAGGALGVALALCVPLQVQAQTPAPDATLFTVYSISPDRTSVNWIVCGSTLVVIGCNGSSSLGTHLGTFGHVGAMLESAPVVSGNTATRQIYVLDTASGSGAMGVTLYVYTEVIDEEMVMSATVTPTTSLSLPLTGGSSVIASMAANNSYLFIGTNQDHEAVGVSKSTWATSTLRTYYPPTNVVASITATSYGWVTITYATPGDASTAGNVIYDPDGNYWGGGSGVGFVVDTINAVVP